MICILLCAFIDWSINMYQEAVLTSLDLTVAVVM